MAQGLGVPASTCLRKNAITFASAEAVQRDNVIQSIVYENNKWMYKRDTNGILMRDTNGALIVNPCGARYIYHLREIASGGLGVTGASGSGRVSC